MKSNEIKISLSSTVVSLSDTRRERAIAQSPFGPLRVGLITTQTTPPAQPLESPSYSVKQAKILQFKYSEVCVTLKLDTEQEGAVEPLLSIIDTDGIK